MADGEQADVIQVIARDIVVQTAPQELPLFPTASRAFFKSPPKPDPKRPDEMLGFGTGEAVAFVTPVILAMVSEVVAYLVEEVKKALKTESSEAINQWINNLFQPGKNNEKAAHREVTPLTPEQIAQVHKIAYKQAISFKLPPDKAKMYADALVGKLILAKPVGK